MIDIDEANANAYLSSDEFARPRERFGDGEAPDSNNEAPAS